MGLLPTHSSAATSPMRSWRRSSADRNSMATEIERKFLVNGDGWRDSVARSSTIRQAYLSQTGATTIRVRIVDDAKAFLTIKSPELGLVRSEFEYSIPVDDARTLLAARVGVLIEKRRHIVDAGDLRWEIDVFEGAHTGLVI